jgi:hypothetical protein
VDLSNAARITSAADLDGWRNVPLGETRLDTWMTPVKMVLITLPSPCNVILVAIMPGSMPRIEMLDSFGSASRRRCSSKLMVPVSEILPIYRGYRRLSDIIMTRKSLEAP